MIAHSVKEPPVRGPQITAQDLSRSKILGVVGTRAVELGGKFVSADLQGGGVD